MGAIATVSKRDFRSYFSSFKGPAIIWFFLIFMGVFFFSFIYTFVELQQRAPVMGGSVPTLVQFLGAMFRNVQFILLLLVPAVTMSSFSEESKVQSFRLLQASPISTFQIVMGKFLACVFVLSTALALSAVFPLFLVEYGNPDINVIATSYLGVFLLICSQVALGIWISSMTSNQFLAFLFTMFGLFLLLILNWIAPNITSNGEAETVVKYLASSIHLDPFLRGLVTVADTVYFFLFAGLFLLFTYISVESKRWR